MASHWRHCADLTGPGIEPQTSGTDSVRLATEPTAGEGNDDRSKWEAKARTVKTDMEETGGRECEESQVKDRGSWRSNEMEGRSESNRGGNDVYPATFGNEKNTGLKLDRRKR